MSTKKNPLNEKLRYHITGSIERGEGEAIRGYNETEERLRFYFHLEDNILDPFTYRQLIILVECNEKVRDKKAFKKCLEEILESRIQDARDMLELMSDKLLKEACNHEGIETAEGAPCPKNCGFRMF